jgi:cytochrome c556
MKENIVTQIKSLKILSALPICSAVFLVPTLAQSAGDKLDKAIASRQGYMKIVVWEAGPLFGMAKGKMEYNAGEAQAHAANLKAISQYPVETLFLPGTSSADKPGKTRALPEIWKDGAGVAKAFKNWRSAIDGVVAAAGKGQGELAAAVGALGKSCGGCHKPFRAKKAS